MPFNYEQTKQIKDTTIAKELELWEVNKIRTTHCSLYTNLLITDKEESWKKTDQFAESSNKDDMHFYKKSLESLTLDNLIPWLEILKIGGTSGIIRDSFIAINYFNNPQKLCDVICEEINNLK